MQERPLVKEGFSLGIFVIGLFFAVAGIVFSCLAFFFDFTLFFHQLALPQWTLYLVAAAAVAIGVHSNLETEAARSFAPALRVSSRLEKLKL